MDPRRPGTFSKKITADAIEIPLAEAGTQKNPLILRVKTQDRAVELLAVCNSKGWQAIVGIEPDKTEDISDLQRKLSAATLVHPATKIGRNEPCPCGSGKKYKKCHGA